MLARRDEREIVYTADAEAIRRVHCTPHLCAACNYVAGRFCWTLTEMSHDKKLFFLRLVVPVFPETVKKAVAGVTVSPIWK